MTTMFALGKRYALRLCAGLAICALAVTTAHAQSASPRITQQIDDAARTTLHGNLSSALHSATDLGAVDTSTPFEHVRLQLQRSSDQQTALDQYLVELQQKASPNYHKWLTPQEFGTRFGLADSDLSAVVGWLESHGMSNVSVASNRSEIDFTGTAGQLQEAFGTTIHSFTRAGRQFYSNVTNPTIPSALSGIVSGVTHLNTLGPRPFSHPGQPGHIDAETQRLTPLSTTSATSSNTPRSNMTLQDSSNNYYLYLVAGDAATIYNTPNSFNANFSSGSSYTGSGVTIGIIGDASVSTTPITNYRTKFLGETSPTAPTITGSTSSTSDSDEAYLDLEISGGMAPGASLHFYTGSDNSLATQISAALTANAVDILSVSFGLCEQDMTTAENTQYYGYWQQAAAQGIAVTVSTGDSGSAGCDATETSSNTLVATATGGLAVNGLASTPYNIAVGGTDFQLTQSNFSTYVGATNSSTAHYRTALSYIPEKVWNDSTQTNTTVSADTAWTTSSSSYLSPNIIGGSGGKSSCSTNNGSYLVSGCTSGYSKPSWQRGTGVPSDSARDIPDISLMAGVDYYAAWLICTEDTYQSYTLDCGSSTGGYYSGIGGTSAAAPAFAGILALVQQSQGGGRLGQAAVNLYNLYNNSASASTIFHDTTVGNNAVPCTSGSTNCSLNGASSYFLTGYNTTTGYDLATGLGSVNATALVSNWSSSLGSATATVSATPASTTINVSNSLSVTIAVSGSSGTPTGSVSISGGGYTSSAVDLDAGSASITIPANSLSVGSVTLTVTYNGDGTYSSGTTTTTITVDSSALTATTTTLAASSTAPSYGTSITLTASVAPTAATGTVTFYDGSSSIGTGTVSSGVATLATSALTVGTHSLTAAYGGNSTYAGSTSSAVSVTVSSSSSGGFGLSATNLTVSQGASGVSTVTVTPTGGYVGTVIFALSTSSTSLQNYGCYTLPDVAVSGTTAVSDTLTLYTSEDVCNTLSSAHTKSVYNFNGTLHHVSRNQAPAAPGRNPLPYSAAALAGVLLLSLRKRARGLSMLGCILLLGSLGAAIGCGGGSSSSGGNEVAKGTYTVTVQGEDTTSTSISASTTMTLTVD